MDITAFLELKPAPRAVFDALPERRSRVRFLLLTADGDWRAITWGGFARAIREVACFLGAVGLEAGDRAAVFAPNRVEWGAAALAIQSAGGVMVPVYPASTAEQAGYILGHCDAKVVFVDPEFDAAAAGPAATAAWDREPQACAVLSSGADSCAQGAA